MTTTDAGRSGRAVEPAGGRTWLAVHRHGGSADRPAFEIVSVAGEGATVAESDRATVLVAGALSGARRPGAAEHPADAASVLGAFERVGEGVFETLRGHFALVAWDRERDTLVFGRDQLGHHSLFFAHGSDGLYLSESIETLVRHPAVGSEIDRAAVADMLVSRLTDPDATCFAAVSRARAGWRYRVDRGRISAERYWFPVAPDEKVDWVERSELGEFDELMRAAVAQPLRHGRSSVFLSGGLDSVAVATYAADLADADSTERPLALSLAFPEEGYDESEIQRLVARRLDLHHALIPFADAVADDGLVASAVGTAADWPTPLVNLWQPLYTHLSLLARAQGARTIMTGAGGDEWLSTSPAWSAHALRRGNLLVLYHLYRTYLRSYNVKPAPLLKNLLWRYGVYELARGVAVTGLTRLAPGRAAAVKRERHRAATPAWLAPDPALRAELEDRAGSLEPPGDHRVDFRGHRHDALEHPVAAMEREEVFERGRRLGIETYMPFWDPDLVGFLARIPPRLLNEAYLSKGLVRARLAARFPEAGFDRQKKILAVGLSERLLAEQTPGTWEAVGGPSALAEIGILGRSALESEASTILAGSGRQGLSPLERSIAVHRLWNVLNVEAWVRRWAV